VRVSRARLDDPGEVRPVAAPALVAWASRDVSLSGIMGDATAATAEKGERWLEHGATAYARSDRGDLPLPAATYLVQYGDLARIDSQPWDPSVRALAHYPTVVSWMAENIAWTQALGAAFASSPADVMDSIQRLRARAAAAGVLVSTPQQRVAFDNGEIEIIPAEPDSLYVPAYDPDAVYPDQAAGAYDASLIFFGDPYPMGPWLAYSFDWRRHRVWEGGCWQGQNGWRPRHFYGDRPPVGTHPWRPREGGTAPSGPGEFRRANQAPGARIPIPHTPARNTGRIPGSTNSGNTAGAHPGAASTSAPAESRLSPPQK
jgi:hypothetical protein